MLDWNATAPLRPQARAAMLAALDAVGNPSSVHAEGRAARRLIEEAREQVAALVGRARRATWCSPPAGPRPICWRSRRRPERRQGGARPAAGFGDRASLGARRRTVPGGGGRARAGDGSRRDRSRGARTPAGAAPAAALLVSLMLANNETGVVQPVSEAARLIHEAGGLLHVDAVQAAGRIPCDINALGADLLTRFWAQDRRAQGRRRADAARRDAAARRSAASRAAARSAAGGPAPRTCRASPASALRQRRRGPLWPRTAPA